MDVGPKVEMIKVDLSEPPKSTDVKIRDFEGSIVFNPKEEAIEIIAKLSSTSKAEFVFKNPKVIYIEIDTMKIECQDILEFNHFENGGDFLFEFQCDTSVFFQSNPQKIFFEDVLLIKNKDTTSFYFSLLASKKL